MGSPAKARRRKGPSSSLEAARISVVRETGAKPRTHTCPHCSGVVEVHLVKCVLDASRVFEKTACKDCDYGTCSDSRPRRRSDRVTAIGGYVERYVEGNGRLSRGRL